MTSHQIDEVGLKIRLARTYTCDIDSLLRSLQNNIRQVKDTFDPDNAGTLFDPGIKAFLLEDPAQVLPF